jgi:hypothetical protein
MVGSVRCNDFFFAKENLMGCPLFPGISRWRASQLPAMIVAGNPERFDLI